MGRNPSIRDRVAHHLRQIALAGAATGSLLAGPHAGAAESAPPGGAQPPPYPKKTSYDFKDDTIVCDPLPAPVDLRRRCSHHIAPALNPHATWEDTSAVRFTLTIAALDVADAMGTPTVSGARVEKAAQSAGRFSALLLRDLGAREISLEVPVRCETSVKQVTLRIDVSGAPVAGAELPIVAQVECEDPWTSEEVARSIAATPKWSDEATVELAVDLLRASLGFRGVPKPRGASLVSYQVEGATRLTVQMKPGKDAAETRVALPITCHGDPRPLEYRLLLPKERRAGSAVPGEPVIPARRTGQ